MCIAKYVEGTGPAYPSGMTVDIFANSDAVVEPVALAAVQVMVT
jgi:hypothetical protein